jgi:hypothetical protein
VAISPNSRWVVTGSDDNTARLWDLTAKDPAANPVVLRGLMSIRAVTISPDSRWVVTCDGSQTARVWDLRAKDPAANPVVLWEGENGRIRSVAVSPDNRWVVTGSDDKTAQLWDLTAKDPAANPVILRGHNGRVSAVAVSPDNRWVITLDGNTARLWLLKVNDMISLARETVGRNFYNYEWRRDFPGEKYRKIFDDLPSPEEGVTQKIN